MHRWSGSHSTSQLLAVPASQRLGDVTRAGNGWELAPYAKMTAHCTPILARITTAPLSGTPPKKSRKQRGCCQFGWHTRSSYRAQSQRSLFNSYILYHLMLKTPADSWQRALFLFIYITEHKLNVALLLEKQLVSDEGAKEAGTDPRKNWGWKTIEMFLQLKPDSLKPTCKFHLHFSCIIILLKKIIHAT